MNELNNILQNIDNLIGGSAWFTYLLLGTGLFFTIYLKFPQIRYFRHALRIVRGKYDRESDQGDTSHFQSLTTALSGTVGTGNISGVALAVHFGGPAALFWMMVTAGLGMTTKFVEVTLSHKYREVDSKGKIAGGPMYYMKNALNAKWLAVIFAAATVISSFGTGSLPQINSIADTIYDSFSLPKMLTGGVLALLLGFVIIGGIKRIAAITEKLVPIMAFFYFIGAMLVILYNIENVVPSIVSIFTDIFSGSAATGGFLGATVAYAFNRGVNRGLFSNEAGQGSAPIAHAAAKAHEPVSEGMVAILEPFVDTIIICMLTGVALLSSGAWNEKFPNNFENAELIVLADTYDVQNEQHQLLLHDFVNRRGSVATFKDSLHVVDGIIQENVTVIHAESVAENVKVLYNGKPFTGAINFLDGKLADSKPVLFHGESLIHSASLTTEAFKRSWLGEHGKYIVSIGLLLFAFSTAISWSYYGDRAMTFMFGTRSVIIYQIVYVIGFFIAAFTDTKIIWTFSGIAIAVMTIPNLLGILVLHKDMRQTLKDYWKGFREDHPDEKGRE